jgi:hypothetical protein
MLLARHVTIYYQIMSDIFVMIYIHALVTNSVGYLIVANIGAMDTPCVMKVERMFIMN